MVFQFFEHVSSPDLIKNVANDGYADRDYEALAIKISKLIERIEKHEAVSPICRGEI